MSDGHEHNADHHHDHDHTHDGHAHTHDGHNGEHHHHDHEHGHHHHDGHDHDHDHGADSSAGVPENLKKNLALLDYMLNHNRDHAGELAGMAGKLRELNLGAAADLVEEGVADFGRGNEKLARALASIREGNSDVPFNSMGN